MDLAQNIAVKIEKDKQKAKEREKSQLFQVWGTYIISKYKETY